jgi:hypothetical protein
VLVPFGDSLQPAKKGHKTAGQDEEDDHDAYDDEIHSTTWSDD